MPPRGTAGPGILPGALPIPRSLLGHPEKAALSPLLGSAAGSGTGAQGIALQSPAPSPPKLRLSGGGRLPPSAALARGSVV